MRKSIIFMVMTTILGSLGFTSCSSDNIEPDLPEVIKPEIPTEIPIVEERKAIELTSDQKNLLEDLNLFSLDLMLNACKFTDAIQEKNGNIICSPLGIELILSMVANGTKQESQNTILKYMGVSDLQALNSLNSELIKYLPLADKASFLKLNNAIWWNSNLISFLNPDYSSLFSDIYKGSIFSGNFSTNNTEILNDINKWGADSTNGHILNYLPSLNEKCLAIILNALTFNSYWSDELFDADSITSGIFYGTDKNSKVEVMKSNVRQLYIGENENYYYITIPYGNRAFSMNVLLPKVNNEETFFSNSAIQTQIRQLQKDGELRATQIELPKFSISSKLNISEVLSSSYGFNEKEAFDFTMFNPLKSGFVQYKQGVEIVVDEKGVDTSSISSAEIVDIAPDPDGTKPEILKISINHPFYFFINEYSTGITLVSGKINNL